ncbi:MAG: TerC/Alx family metal homeostasis membrane protein [Actinomycetes bacterium]
MTSTLIWTLTVVGVLGFIVFDFLVVVRKPHEPTFRESVRWTVFYISMAGLFGLSMMWWRPADADGTAEFFAGYVTEWSLSVDNLFVFLVILSRFAVPMIYRQRVLLIGIAIALVLRAAFILAGAAALHAWSWVFYLFGAFLLWTAFSVAREGGAEEGEVEYTESRFMRWFRRVFSATEDFRGAKLFVKENGKRLITPMLLVMIAIGTTDVLFALDSIPAIFGLTQDPYIVFVANAFALMGLRQLFFVVEGLLRRLVYLSYGLAFILAFIGVKLFLEALRTNTLPFVNGGEHVDVPEISTWFSLGVILVSLLAAAGASLIATRNAAKQLEASGADASEKGLEASGADAGEKDGEG